MSRPALVSFAALALVAACGPKPAAPENSAASEAVENTTATDVANVGGAAVGAITTEGFVQSAGMGDLYEIDAARIALDKSKSVEVKRLAQMILDDHTASTARLKMLLGSGKVTGTAPTALDDTHKDMISQLKTANAADFDARYLDQQIMGHHEMLLLMQG
jgi:putative membrane protein